MSTRLGRPVAMKSIMVKFCDGSSCSLQLPAGASVAKLCVLVRCICDRLARSDC